MISQQLTQQKQIPQWWLMYAVKACLFVAKVLHCGLSSNSLIYRSSWIEVICGCKQWPKTMGWLSQAGNAEDEHVGWVMTDDPWHRGRGGLSTASTWRGWEDYCCWPSPSFYILFFMVVCSLLPIQYQLCPGDIPACALWLPSYNHGCGLEELMTTSTGVALLAAPLPMRSANQEAEAKAAK